jgi:hypothetical protein
VILELPQNLRFANHHGIKARRNTEEMADRIAAFIGVNMLFERSGYAVDFVIAQKPLYISASGLTVRCGRDNFYAIAGGKNDALLNGWVGAQLNECIFDVGVFESQAFSDFDGRAAMVQPDDDDLFLHNYSNRPPCRLGKISPPDRK